MTSVIPCCFFRDPRGTGGGRYTTHMARVFAYLVLAVVPAPAFHPVAERQPTDGITVGAAKG